jgi:hypothetical protein
LVARVYFTRNPVSAAAVPNPISRWDFPVPESPIRHSGCPERIHPHPARVDGGRVDVRVRVEIEVGQPLVTGKPGCFDPPDGAAPGPVVALGQQQLGQEPHLTRTV